jgi:hypothetical protein
MGGAALLPFDWSDAGASQFLDELTLSSGSVTDVFFLRCDAGCETGVRVFDDTGGSLWDTVVLSPRFPGKMVATSLISPGLPGTFITVVRAETDAGPQTALALFADGQRKAVCRLPEGSGGVELATFSSTAMVVTVRRPDGGVALESYGLGALQVNRTGWSTPQGLGGSRSDRP